MNILANLFRNKADSAGADDCLQQEEREAILDLLLYCQYTDNHLSLAEDKVLKDEIDSFAWDSGTTVEIYIASATAKARNAQSNRQAKEEFLKSIQARLASETGREKALSSMAKLFSSDGESEEEKAFSMEISARFGK